MSLRNNRRGVAGTEIALNLAYAAIVTGTFCYWYAKGGIEPFHEMARRIKIYFS